MINQHKYSKYKNRSRDEHKWCTQAIVYSLSTNFNGKYTTESQSSVLFGFQSVTCNYFNEFLSMLNMHCIWEGRNTLEGTHKNNYQNRTKTDWFTAFLELIFGKQGKSEGFESCDRPIVRKRPIWVKIGDVLYRVTLKFDGWPWKTKGHLSFVVLSFVQHFIAIGEFKLELQSGNAQFGSNSTIFRAVWPWNLTYDLEKQ